jgi:hypothetical protein
MFLFHAIYYSNIIDLENFVKVIDMIYGPCVILITFSFAFTIIFVDVLVVVSIFL